LEVIFALIFFGFVLIIIVIAITLIAQPPEKLVKWLTGKNPRD
jgi:hypothetical protein